MWGKRAVRCHQLRSFQRKPSLAHSSLVVSNNWMLLQSFYNNPTNIQNIEPNHYSHMSLLRLRLGFDAHLDLMAQLRRKDVSNFIPTCHISAPRARTLPDIHWSIFSACRRSHVPVIRTKSLWSTELQNHSIQRPFNAGRMSSLFHLFVFCWKHFHWYVSRLTYGDVYVALTARTQQLVILGTLFHHLYSIFFYSNLQF